MNEYQRIFQSIGTDFMAMARRWELCQEYAWAIPSDEALDALAEYGPLVEMGAGGGYWAHLLRQRGVDILAYDAKPGDNQWVSKEWTRVRRGGPKKLQKLSDRALFLCWPPYANSMAAECLKNYSGDTVLYIGEGEGGCTGNDEFHHALENDFNIVTVHEIPKWYGIHDQLYVYRRIKK